MADDLRTSADELKQRMEAGEEFTIIDVRNRNAWAEAKNMVAGALRVAADDDVDEAIALLPRDKPIVTYCT